MVLVVHDPERGDLRELLDFELDLAFGSDENAFELTCAEGLAPAEGRSFSWTGASTAAWWTRRATRRDARRRAR